MSAFSHQFAPLYLNNYNRIKPLIHRLPPLSELTMASTLNTIVRCRVCYGQKTTFIRNQGNNTMQESHCPRCNGSGEMSNRE